MERRLLLAKDGANRRQRLALLWVSGAGPDLTALPAVQLDSTIVDVHGRAKQGTAFGYMRVRAAHHRLCCDRRYPRRARLVVRRRSTPGSEQALSAD